jgi:hypothetical protein
LYRYQREALEKQNEYNRGISIDNIKPKTHNDKRYVSLMGSMSHTYGNALAYMQNYIINLFPENLFKTVHVNSKIAHRQIRSTGYEYTKKAKPMIIFRPRIGDVNDDRFLKGTPLIERQGNLYSTWGATNLQPFMDDPFNDIAVKFQMNRSVLYIDVVMVFSTLMQQIDYIHYFQNAVRLNIPFMLSTCFESYIPQEMLKIISDIVDVPLYDENNSTRTFLKYMEGNSAYPITYKLQGSTGTKEFYRYYPVNIDTTIGDLQWNEGEQSGHVMSNYQVSFSVRMEFNSTGFYYIFSDKLFGDYSMLPQTYPEDTSIIPVFTDVVLKEDYDLKPGWRLYSSASCRLEHKNETICIDELLNDSIRKVLEYHRKNGLPYLEFLDIKIRKQGKLLRNKLDYEIDYDTLNVKFTTPEVYYTYKFLICVNVEYVNEFIKSIYNLK